MLTDVIIQKIVDGQTSVTYKNNGPFLVKSQMKHAIKQALLLNDGSLITLPKGEQLAPQSPVGVRYE